MKKAKKLTDFLWTSSPPSASLAIVVVVVVVVAIIVKDNAEAVETSQVNQKTPELPQRATKVPSHSRACGG
jgi:hypothetical protein